MSPILSTLRRQPGPAPDNDDSWRTNEPGFHAAQASDRVWSRLLKLRREGGAVADRAWSAEENAAWALYAPLAAGGRETFVFAQIGQSLDGRIATESGDARDISGHDGLKHLHRCRALADVVVVGVRTVLADNPRLTVRLVEGDSPARVVIDPHGRLPGDCGFFSQRSRTLIVRRGGKSAPSRVETIGLAPVADRLDPHAIVAALAERGFRRILIEGGGATIGHFLDASALDRLHVVVSPLLIGAGPAGLNASPIARLSQARRPRTSVYGLGTDIVFDCAMADPAPGI